LMKKSEAKAIQEKTGGYPAKPKRENIWAKQDPPN